MTGRPEAGPPRPAGPVALVPPAEFGDELVPEVTEGAELGVAEQAALLTALQRVQAEELDPVGCRRALVESAVEALDADLGWLSLVDDDDQGFTVVHSVGMDTGLIDVTKQSVSGLGAEAARRRATLIVNEFRRSTRTPPAARRQLLDAGVRSLICAPLVAGELIGLLCVARRGPHRFAHRDSVLIGTLAAQGAMTIYNGRIFGEVRHRTTTLQAALSVGADVHESLLSGEGLAGAARTLAAALCRAVSIHQSVVAEEPGWFTPEGGSLKRAPSDATVRTDLTAAGEVLGTIEVDGDAPLDAVQQRAVEVASTAIVSELLARRRSEEAEWRLHGELLAELVSAPAPLPRALAIRARRSGVDPTVATVLVVVRDSPRNRASSSLLLDARSALRTRLRSGVAVLAFSRGDSVVLALPAEASTRADVEAVVRAVAAGGRVRAGVGRAADHHSALGQADTCLTLATGPTRSEVVDVDDLGLLGALVGPDPRRHVVETVGRALGPVHQADREMRIPLLRTLEAYCAAEGRIEHAARLCTVHESTFRYRLARLTEVLDLGGAPDSLPAMRVVVEAMTVLRAAGHDPFAGRPSGEPPPGPG
ncbi:helix-turn-helix domain-containing protein [Pseudonocardia alni]|uniref:helix-turn-helix domain-containing protein n=1 Tax=Pseudonocardia alni TaxID=33907 RepID=UPI0033339692